MKMYFDTRKEAREFCKGRGIAYSKINHNYDRGAAWYVEVNEVTRFEKNKIYKISDEQGFVKSGMFTPVNVANKVQLEQIKKHLPDGFKIVSLDFDKRQATFEAPAEVSFNTLRFEEARYVMEVQPVVKAPAAVKKSEQPKPVKVDSPVAPDLDAELNGGVSLTEKEKSPNKFVNGQKYVLINREGFYKKNTHNREIAEFIDANYAGIYDIFDVRGNGTWNHLNITVHDANRLSAQAILHDTERKFFREYNPAPAVVSTEDIRKNKHEELLKNIEVAQKELDTAKENYGVALDARNKALDNLTEAFKAMGEFLK